MSTTRPAIRPFDGSFAAHFHVVTGAVGGVAIGQAIGRADRSLLDRGEAIDHAPEVKRGCFDALLRDPTEWDSWTTSTLRG